MNNYQAKTVVSIPANIINTLFYSGINSSQYTSLHSSFYQNIFVTRKDLFLSTSCGREATGSITLKDTWGGHYGFLEHPSGLDVYSYHPRSSSGGVSPLVHELSLSHADLKRLSGIEACRHNGGEYRSPHCLMCQFEDSDKVFHESDTHGRKLVANYHEYCSHEYFYHEAGVQLRLNPASQFQRDRRHRAKHALDGFISKSEWRSTVVNRIVMESKLAGAIKDNCPVHEINRLKFNLACLAADSTKTVYSEPELSYVPRKYRGRGIFLPTEHIFLSFSLPNAVRRIFTFSDEWFFTKALTGKEKGCKAAYSLSKEATAKISKGSFTGVTELMRRTFQKALVAAVEDIHPDIQLNMLSKMHPHGTCFDVPDQHFLISRIGRHKDGRLVDVDFTQDQLNEAYRSALIALTGLSCDLARTSKSRDKEFRAWKKHLKGFSKQLPTNYRPSPKNVDMRLTRDNGKVGKYIYRKPMSKAQHISYNGGKYLMLHQHKGKGAQLTPIQLLKRFTGSYRGCHSLHAVNTGAYAVERTRRQDVSQVADELMSMRIPAVRALMGR